MDATLRQGLTDTLAEMCKQLINLRRKIRRIRASHKVQLTAQPAAEKNLFIAALFQLVLRLILQLGIAHRELAAHRRHALATLL